MEGGSGPRATLSNRNERSLRRRPETISQSTGRDCRNGFAFAESFLLIGTTTLIAALPILAIVIVGPKADNAMPGIREWMNNNSWLISIIVYVFFIYAMLS